MSMTPLLLAMTLGMISDSDETVLADARLKTTDQALLDFFRKRSLPPPEPNAIKQLTKKLASKDTEQADAAQSELLSLGAAAIPLLRQIANLIDEPQASTRTRHILQLIEGPQAASLSLEAARLLAARKPAGAAQALLDYLPFADDDIVFAELEAALLAVGVRHGKLEPVLLAALKDPRPVCRGTAAKVLCQATGAAHSQVVRPLLKDPESSVRLKAALALASAHDPESIPVLIDLLADAPRPLRTQAEQYLTELAGEWAVRGPRGDDVLSRQLRRAVWTTWWKEIDSQKILQELQARALTDEEWEKAQTLLRQLTDENPDVKESATRALVGLGPRATALLRRAIHQDSPDISPAAARCLDIIERDFPPLPLSSAFRLLGLRRPEGTVAALLAFLPCAEHEEMVNQIRDVLIHTGVAEGKPDERLVQALEDKTAIRRIQAAAVLCRARAVAAWPAVRKLLADKDPKVRLQVAEELASVGEKEGIRTLIALLEEFPEERVWEVEEYLEKLAGDKAPSEINKNPFSWKVVGSAWTKWWGGDKSVVMIDMAGPSLGGSLRGYTLLVQPQANTITELDAKGKPRWNLTGLMQPVDAEVVSGQRVLVVEQGGGGQVSERTLQGTILWQKQLPQPSTVQRLRNGNTLIACSNQLIEVNRTGKEVRKIDVQGRNGLPIVAARKLSNRHFFAFDRRDLIHLDPKGRELNRVSLQAGGGGNNEVLDNGHVLVLSPGNGNLIEFDIDGKEVGRFDVQGAGHAFRLPNGHTLLLVNGTKYLELDKKWKVIKETPLMTPAFRVKRR